VQQPGTLIEGRYEILGKIREGGMGTIYKVRHRLLDEIRVVKVMKPSITADAEMKHRFADEAKMATKLKHPNIGTIHDFALDEDGTAYLVMEFIDGVNLGELLGNKGPPETPMVLEIAHQALLALGYLHRRNIIHRDVAPDNLMLTHDEEGQPRIKLIDLGIAKALDRPTELTSAGVFLGKLKYASPEQYGALPAGEKLDGRSDCYSLGVVMYELLTDMRPFKGETPAELLRAHLFSSPIPFEESDPKGRVPADIRKVVLRALEKKREDRYASAEDFDREIVALRDRYGRAGLEQTVQMLTAVRQTPVAGQQDQTITPSAQSRLDRQFAGPTTPTTAAPGLVAVPRGSSEAKTQVVTGTGSRPSKKALPWMAAAVLVLAAVVLLTKRPWESHPRPAALPTPVAPSAIPSPAAPADMTTAAPPTEAPTAAPATSEPTVARPDTAAAEMAAERTAAEQARRLASRARADAERLGSAARAPGPYQLGRKAEDEGNRLMTQGRFSAARAAFEKSTDRFSDAQSATAELLARAPVATAPPPPPPTHHAEPTRVAVILAEPTPLPTPAPPVKAAAPAEQERIREVLREYERAHNTLDVDLYARAFPSFVSQHRQDLDRAWQGLKSQHLELEVRQIEVHGSQAVVRGVQKLTVVPQAGSEQRDSREVVFKLEKRGDAWVIVERT
jgi:serine/threonine-protein kinase